MEDLRQAPELTRDRTRKIPSAFTNPLPEIKPGVCPEKSGAHFFKNTLDAFFQLAQFATRKTLLPSSSPPHESQGRLQAW